MNTWSHLLVGAVINRPVKKSQETKESQLPPIQTKWFLFGSVLPDLMLIFMAIIAIGVDLSRGVYTLSTMFDRPEGGGDGPPEAFNESTIGWLFRDAYFTDPWVKAGHSIFGTPIMLIAYILIGYWLWKNGRKWGPVIFWLALGAMIHTLADIPLHTDDGPLLFWPLNWSYRFESPVSYWDPDHHGRTWAIFETWLNVALIAWLVGGWLIRKFRPKPS